MLDPGVQSIFGIETYEPAMRLALELGLRASGTSYSVLIGGETGTGKELVARGIHRASGRRGAFIPVNCGAIPEQLFEAELFGARRGAFTGLDRERPGLITAAEGGTLFLDEVGELPLATQTKLLRVLEQSEILPLGGCTFVRTNVRVLAATNRDLRKMATENRFRDDLLYRIAAVEVRLPPLRERPLDILLMLTRALNDACTEQRRDVPPIDRAVFDAVLGYSWPGNVREILHMVAAALLSSNGESLGLSDFPLALQASAPPPDSQCEVPQSEADEPSLFEALAVFECAYLARILARTNNNLSHAARIAGISRPALRAKARQYGLVPGLTPGGELPASRSRFRAARRLESTG